MHYSLVGEVVEARITQATVELLRDGKRITSHARSFEPGRHTTKPEHMPKAHQKQSASRPTYEPFEQILPTPYQSRPFPTDSAELLPPSAQ